MLPSENPPAESPTASAAGSSAAKPHSRLVSRLITAVNLSIAVLLIGVIVAAYWYAWRPLPETSGQISAPVSAAARITRDAIGVPHIQAASWEDAIFLEGYAMAQDRLWQMDGMRRRAAGELSEIAGPLAATADQESRRMGLRRTADALEQALRPDERVLFAAFARGVNLFINTHHGRLPLEFSLLRYDPRPWTVRDSLLAALEMYRTLSNSWRNELTKEAVIEAGDRAKADYLFPVRTGSDPQPGSNAWALSGAKTTSGKPLLANDPHLEFSAPSPWYLVHLQAPGLNVTGATIVGLPAVVIGHNDRIAWGVTNLQFDTQDLFEEKTANVQQSAIAVKGSRAVPVTIGATRRGPLLAADGGHQYALQWTANQPGGFAFPFLDVDRARNWTEFRAALERFGGPGQNFVYADVEGNIGYQAAGWLPDRKDCPGDIPATDSKCEWSGRIPFAELPSIYNPPSGMIVTANQNPFPADYKHRVDGNFAAPYRANQIRALLSSRAKWKAEEMLRVQTDVYSAFDRFLAQQIIAAFDRQKPDRPQAKEAVDILRKWNGQMETGLAAPMVTSLTYRHLLKLVLDRVAAGMADRYQSFMARSVIERLLRERPEGWFPDYDALLLRCLTGALEEGSKAHGSKVSLWDYGQFQRLQIESPVGSRLPVIGTYFTFGPVPMGGSPTSVKQYSRTLGPSLRMVVDLSDLEHSFANLATGESGHRLSPHYKDQWDAYLAGRSFPMQFGKIEAKDVLVIKPVN